MQLPQMNEFERKMHLRQFGETQKSLRRIGGITPTSFPRTVGRQAFSGVQIKVMIVFDLEYRHDINQEMASESVRVLDVLFDPP